MSEINHTKQSALLLASMGLPLFPVIPNGKKPAIADWGKKATCDPVIISGWWDSNPNYNIGLAAGHETNGKFLTVIDLDRHDPAKDGLQSLAGWCVTHGELPRTAEVSTPSGGRHLYYWTPSPLKNRTGILPGIDARGAGGYVVAPTSRINGKSYDWIENPIITGISDANENVLTLLNYTTGPERPSFALPEAIEDGQRTDTLIRLVGSLMAKGLSEDAIRAAVMAENITRCFPPLSDNELEKTVFPALRRFSGNTAPYIQDNRYTLESESILPLLASLRPERNYGWHDAGNGKLLSDLCKSKFRYVLERKKWYCYDECKGIWAVDEGDARIMSFCKSIADALMLYTVHYMQDAEDKRKSEYRKAVVDKWYQLPVRKKIIEDAESVCPMTADSFDRDPLLLNCQNGVLNLHSGEFREHRPEDFITKSAAVVYDPAARCERWEQFIDEVMQGDKEKAVYLQKALAYALTGDTSRECFFILYGATSRNGKGTLCETFSAMMGDYAKTAAPETIAQRKYSDSRSPTEDLARLAGARFVNISEPDKNMILSASLVKQMTGNNTITARFLHENSFQYKPQFKMFIDTNHLPTISDSTLFSSDRVITIEFNRHFLENERDPQLKRKLTTSESLSGILNWCLEGLRLLKTSGLNPPASVREATQAYKESSDKLEQFIGEVLIADPNGEITVNQVHERYQTWCYSNGLRAEGKVEFNKSLASAGLTIKRTWPKGMNSRNGGKKMNLIYGYRL